MSKHSVCSSQQFPVNRPCLPLRKNACVVCNVCFTCSKYYAVDCVCAEVQPRRGKNLPQGALDSRAKKLHSMDTEDYKFSLRWLMEHAHPIYRDSHGSIPGLASLTEVSLCKAHSSTLYRAKMRFKKDRLAVVDVSKGESLYQWHMTTTSNDTPFIFSALPFDGHSRLASKVHSATDHFKRELRHLSAKEASTSLKTQREDMNKLTQCSSTSTSNLVLTNSYGVSFSSPVPHAKIVQHSSLHVRQQSHEALGPNAHTLSLPFAPRRPQVSIDQPHHNNDESSSLIKSSYPGIYGQINKYEQSPPNSPCGSSPSPSPLPFNDSTILETVSLKSGDADTPVYYIQNLAITDTFTFRDLLAEANVPTFPPPGKRIIISDENNSCIFPLDQAIRSIFPRPAVSHFDFRLGLANKTPVNWDTYNL